MGNNLVFQENSIVNEENISRQSSLKQNNIAGGILYQRQWNSNLKSEALIYGTRYLLQGANADITDDQRLLQENEVLESGLKLNSLLKMSTHFNLNNGYQFNETGISDLRDLNNPTFKDFVKEVVRTHSVFSEMEYLSSNHHTHINFGARLNYFDKIKTLRLEPRISFLQDINNQFSFEILGELKSQTTSQVIDSQNDFLGVENRKWLLSNGQDIPLITSEQLSLGLNYNHNNWLITAEMYYKNVDGITAKSQGFQNAFEGKNDIGNYQVYGVDFLLNKRFKNLRTWMSYSLAKNNYNFLSLSTRRFPNNLDIRQNVNIAFSYDLNSFKFSSGLNWHSGKPTTNPLPPIRIENDKIIFEDANSRTLPDYIRFDTSATYQINFSEKINGTFGISLLNIFNQKNIINNYFLVKDDNTTIRETKEFGLGLTPNIVVRINF